MKIFLSFITLTTIFLSTEALAKNCQEVRMGLDIGSGSTKMLVAKVDFCERKILEVLHSDSKAIHFNEDLEKSKDGALSPAIIDQGLKTLTELVNKGKTFKPKRTYGVATSVFRNATNGVDVIKTYARKLGLRLEVISQTDEAMLGYLSVKALSNEKDFVVWDIGGGSMQMFSQVANKKPLTYLGNIASVTFKNMVIEVIEQKNPDEVLSPNPIGDKRDQVITLARSYARLHVPLDLKNALKTLPVVGVGGVHSASIKNQLSLKEPRYTLEELQAGAKAQSQKSDKELAGDYRATDVTNLLLVQGYMEALGIKEVKIINATLVQGAVLKN